MIEIVKRQLDLGLLTDRPAVVAYWRDEIGLTLDHVLPIRAGHDQHRFDLAGSVIKVNLLEDLDARGRAGFRALVIAREGVEAPEDFVDPDGNAVQIVPVGTEGVQQMGVRLEVPDLDAALGHYRDVLGFAVEPPGRLRCGDSVILLEESAEAPRAVTMPVRGWTYLTVQVRDCDAEVERIESLGGRIASRPVNMGKVARMAMVADPFGNLLEVSQRASIVGALPE